MYERSFLSAADSYLANEDELHAAASPRQRGGGAGSGGERYQIFVHLDEDVLGDNGAKVATLDDGTRLPAETLRRLACDCGLVATRTDADGSVLDVGRRTRSIPPAIRRALWLRDRGCRFPGCGHHRFLHGHHVSTGWRAVRPGWTTWCWTRFLTEGQERPDARPRPRCPTC